MKCVIVNQVKQSIPFLNILWIATVLRDSQRLINQSFPGLRRISNRVSLIYLIEQ